MAAVLEVPLVHRLVVLWLLCFSRVLVERLGPVSRTSRSRSVTGDSCSATCLKIRPPQSM